MPKIQKHDGDLVETQNYHQIIDYWTIITHTMGTNTAQQVARSLKELIRISSFRLWPVIQKEKGKNVNKLKKAFFTSSNFVLKLEKVDQITNKDYLIYAFLFLFPLERWNNLIKFLHCLQVFLTNKWFNNNTQ